MSEFNIEIEGGSSVRLPTAGKYCDRDIVVEATEGPSKKQLFAMIQRSRMVIDFTELPNGITGIGAYAFAGCGTLRFTSIPESVTSINNYAFNSCSFSAALTFKGTPSYIAKEAFYGCTTLLILNVPWAEGEVANAPWGATNATINYNYKEE